MRADVENELYIEQIECGPMANFVYLVGSRSSREVALVDPAWEIDRLLEIVRERDMTPVAALVTHYHPDHIGGEIHGHSIEGLSELLSKQGMKVWVHKTEAEGVRRLTGLSDSDLVLVDSQDKLTLGDVEIEFIHTPGHTPGSQCFRIRNTLVSGDTLFIRGCGRVDLPGSDVEQMYESLQKLSELPEDVLLLPGHNYAEITTSTIGDEKRTNPYLRLPRETWLQMMGAG